MAQPQSGKHVGVCDAHGKRLYLTRKDAKAAIRRLPDRRGMRAYRCQEQAHLYHVGHLPQATVYGLKTAAEVYRPEVA